MKISKKENSKNHDYEQQSRKGRQMGQFETLVKQIQEPLAEFTPVPFWFFNDEPDEEKIAAQLADYVDKGVNAIVLHP